MLQAENVILLYRLEEMMKKLLNNIGNINNRLQIYNYSKLAKLYQCQIKHFGHRLQMELMNHSSLDSSYQCHLGVFK